MHETTELSPALQAAWGLRQRPAKGPKPTLSAERIVEAAVGIARAEGFGAVSMSRVAGELNASAMSLYRHVANKDELAMLMLEAAISVAPPEPKRAGETWRAALERWAWAMRSLFQENLWILHVPISGPPATPKQLAWMESGLQSLDGVGLTAAEQISVMMLLIGLVRSDVGLVGQMVDAARAGGRTIDDVMAEYGTVMHALVTAERFPMLHKLVESGLMDQADHPDTEFIFGLGRLLDGVERLVESRPS
jgi:AcrR family transcriptional regulator